MSSIGSIMRELHYRFMGARDDIERKEVVKLVEEIEQQVLDKGLDRMPRELQLRVIKYLYDYDQLQPSSSQ